MSARCTGSGGVLVGARRCALPGSSSTSSRAAARSTDLVRQRDVRSRSDKMEAREPRVDSEKDAAATRDSSPPPPRPAPSSDAAPAEESTDDGPPDQRPMLVRILMSVFRSFWQSIGRVWEVLSGTKSLRNVFFLFVLAVYNVRTRFLHAIAIALTAVLPFTADILTERPGCAPDMRDLAHPSFDLRSALVPGSARGNSTGVDFNIFHTAALVCRLCVARAGRQLQHQWKCCTLSLYSLPAPE